MEILRLPAFTGNDIMVSRIRVPFPSSRGGPHSPQLNTPLQVLISLLWSYLLTLTGYYAVQLVYLTSEVSTLYEKTQPSFTVRRWHYALSQRGSLNQDFCNLLPKGTDGKTSDFGK